MPSSSACTASKCPSTTTSSRPCTNDPTPYSWPPELVEPLRHRVDVEVRREPHRDQSPRQHEPGDAVDVEHRLRLIGRLLGGDAVHREEGVGPVDDGLGAFGFRDRVLHRPRVQAQFLRQVLEDRVVGVVDVAPHQRVVLDQVVRDRREVEIVLRLAGPPHPASDVRHPDHHVKWPSSELGKLARPRSIAARLACVRLLTPNLA